MPIKEFSVSTIDELTATVLTITRTLPPGHFLWFRGLTCLKYTLIPTLLRDSKTEKEVFDREHRLLTRFRQRSMAYWPTGYPQTNWEHMFAMQHYGMPTRLLDWSENLFVAAYFALGATRDHSAAHPGEPCKPVIWCLDPIEWNRSTPVLEQFGDSIHVLTTADEELEPYEPATNKRRHKTPVAMFGSHNSNRIVAQRGTFLAWGNDLRCLEDISADSVSKATLSKITLDGSRNDLSSALRSLGFSETMVFPELQSLGAELTRTEGWKS
jgi:hypothetical protein